MAVTGVKRQKDDFRVSCPPICKQADNWGIVKSLYRTNRVLGKAKLNGVNRHTVRSEYGMPVSNLPSRSNIPS